MNERERIIESDSWRSKYGWISLKVWALEEVVTLKTGSDMKSWLHETGIIGSLQLLAMSRPRAVLPNRNMMWATNKSRMWVYIFLVATFLIK